MYYLLSILFSVSCITQANDGQRHDKDYIRFLIASEAVRQGINPDLAISVAIVESGLRPHVVGRAGEQGLFQIIDRKLERTGALLDPYTNVKRGVAELKYWQTHCPVKENYTYVTCYNQGSRHPKFPYLNKYYLKVMEAMR